LLNGEVSGQKEAVLAGRVLLGAPTLLLLLPPAHPTLLLLVLPATGTAWCWAGEDAAAAASVA
jgi:hypothetical protein